MSWFKVNLIPLVAMGISAFLKCNLFNTYNTNYSTIIKEGISMYIAIAI